MQRREGKKGFGDGCDVMWCRPAECGAVVVVWWWCGAWLPLSFVPGLSLASNRLVLCFEVPLSLSLSLCFQHNPTCASETTVGAVDGLTRITTTASESASEGGVDKQAEAAGRRECKDGLRAVSKGGEGQRWEGRERIVPPPGLGLDEPIPRHDCQVLLCHLQACHIHSHLVVSQLPWPVCTTTLDHTRL